MIIYLYVYAFLYHSAVDFSSLKVLIKCLLQKLRYDIAIILNYSSLSY